MRGNDEQFQMQFAMPRMHVFILCVWPNDEFVRDILALYGGDFDEMKEKHALMDEATKRVAIAMLYECSKQNGEQEMCDMLRCYCEIHEPDLCLNWDASPLAPRPLRKRRNKYRRP